MSELSISKAMFVGDTTWPRKDCLRLGNLRERLDGCAVVANLEGPILEVDPFVAAILDPYKFNLYSDRSILDVARSLNVAAFSFANNHIGDYRGGIESSARLLSECGIASFGTERRPSTEFTIGNRTFVVIGVCSPLTEPRRAGLAGHGAAEFVAHRLLTRIAALRAEKPHARIAIYVHWGYELSPYPEPADREWARRAIDAGADFVIGHHPHVVQGIERHRDGLIAYSVGNFLLPQTTYRDRCLQYRDASVLIQLGLCVGDTVNVSWMKYDPRESHVHYERTVPVDQDEDIVKLTPYSGMTDEDYRRWFRDAIANGQISRRIGQPTFWSYFGSGRCDAVAKRGFLRVKRGIRKLAIRTGIHKPYNW